MVITPPILFVELSSRGISQSEGNECYPFYYVWERKDESRRRRKKNRDNTRREREKIYV
jgi:hypothetical protein